jgi:hypothetical protein
MSEAKTLVIFSTLFWALVLFVFRRTVNGNDSIASNQRLWVSSIKLGLFLGLLRVANLWYLTYLNWSGQQSLSNLLPALLLLPEAGVMPKKWDLTAGNVWLFSAVLMIGSVVISLVVAVMSRTVAALNRRLRPRCD